MKHSESIISTEIAAELSLALSASPVSEAELDFALDLEEHETRTFDCDSEVHGLRLDAALVSLVNEFSRSYLKQLVEGGFATLNGAKVTKVATKIKAGDQLSIALRATPQSQAFKPEFVDFPVVFEDDHLLVVNKPAGLVVHPAPGNWGGTLLNGLLYRDKDAQFLPRAGIVHRLDKDTSGLMVVARTRLAMDALVKKISERSVHRQYIALANHPWVGARHRDVEESIGRDPKNRLRMAVVSLDKQYGKTAKTSVSLLQNSDQGCLVQCKLHTGRTHQIRVHMAFLGHPLVADAVYGGAKGAGMLRQALHAERLEFEHPMTGQNLQFKAAPPADMLSAFEQWGLSYNGGS